MPKISIILPTYNVEKYIARALDSCINQTLKDIEIIVVDDKGNDNSIKIAQDYASRDDRIKIIDNHINLKPLYGRINGVKNAISKLIMFLDPDDELELNACKIAYDNFDANKKVLRFNVKAIGFDRVKCFDFPATYDEFIQKTAKMDFVCFLQVANLFDKELYLRACEYLNEFDLQGIWMSEDTLINFLINNINKEYAHVDQQLYIYHSNSNSACTTEDINQIQKNISDKMRIANFFVYLADKYPSIFKNDIFYSNYFYMLESTYHLHEKLNYLKYKHCNYIKYKLNKYHFNKKLNKIAKHKNFIALRSITF